MTRPDIALSLATLLVTFSGGCGSAPSISAERVGEIAAAFDGYALDAETTAARWIEGLTPAESDQALAEVQTLAWNLRAEAANIKTTAAVERVERLGVAMGSLPFPWAKVAGAGLGLVALGWGLLGSKKIKRPPQPSGGVA